MNNSRGNRNRFNRGGCGNYQSEMADEHNENGTLIPVLSEMPVGTKCKVKSFVGHMMKKRLANMGLGTGSEIEIIKNDPSGGPLIVFVSSVRIALGRGMARHIQCEVIKND